MFRSSLSALVGLLIVGCASRSAPVVQGSPATAADRGASVGQFPIDTTSRRPSLGTATGGTLMAERSLQEGILGSKTNPILANGPVGQRDYLRRLQCPNGRAPQFVRNGSLGAANRGADGHIIDVYTIGCSGTDAFLVYMDMYHNERMMAAIPGFEILPELPERLATGCPPQVTTNADSNATWVFGTPEVATPARPLEPLTTTLTGASRGSQQISFIVDTLGVPEPESITAGALGAADRFEVAKKMILGLRFAPAEHHPGCKVRMRAALTLQFQ